MKTATIESLVVIATSNTCSMDESALDTGSSDGTGRFTARANMVEQDGATFTFFGVSIEAEGGYATWDDDSLIEQAKTEFGSNIYEDDDDDDDDDDDWIEEGK